MMNRRRQIVVLMAFHLLVSCIVGAATFTSTLPLEPERLLKPLGSCFDVTLPEGVLDIGELPDNEYIPGPPYFEYSWSVEGGGSGTGLTATVNSSLNGGTGVISSPGDYSVVFSGTATYYVAWREGDEERVNGPFTVPLTPSEGGRLTMPFRLVAVEKLACGDIVSRTSSPGTAETLVVPVGYNNGSVTVAATPTPSGEWPEECPSWSGDILSCNGDTATVDTSTPGLKTVTASCGNSISLKVQVIGVSGVTVRRKGTADAFGASATIAAGGKNTDVHKAEIRIQLTPLPLKQVTLTVPASLSGAAAHAGTNVAAVLVCGNSTLTGNSSGTITISDIDLATGCATAFLTSSNVIRTCTVTIDGHTVDAAMTMAARGNRAFDWPAYFIYGVSHDIDFFPTLQEAADHDADADGTAGEGAITGHDIHFYVSTVSVSYWRFDWLNFEFIDIGGDDIECPIGGDPLLIYGLRLSDLMDFGDTSESIPGKYTDSETVYCFYDFDDTTFVETCVEIESYIFSVYDNDVYNY